MTSVIPKTSTRTIRKTGRSETGAAGAGAAAAG
jgi:hypothetical protein